VGADRGEGNGRQGIALIVVLGFLSILILMAVALVTLTRTERLVAATSVEGIRAKVLARGAIDAAINDINSDFWPDQRIHPSKRDRALFQSQGTGSLVGPNVNLFGGEATNWVPRKYLSTSDVDYNIRSKWQNSEWILVRDPTNAATGTILGRYAYLVVDCTGLLDANLVASPSPGAGGTYTNMPLRTSVRHVPIDLLPEAGGVPGTAASEAFRKNRENYHGFSTIREIIGFNDGLDLAGYYSDAFSEGNVLSGQLVNNLGPFSLSYDRGWWDWSSAQWRRGMLPAIPEDISMWTDEQAALVFQQVLGLDVVMANEMLIAFIDYKDADRVPQSTTAYTVEAVPMFNEFILSVTVDTDVSGTVGMTVNLVVETWYPFPSREPLAGYAFLPNEPSLGASPGMGNITFMIATPSGLYNYGAVVPNSSAVIGQASYNDGRPQAWDPLVYRIENIPATTNDLLRMAMRIDDVQMWNGGSEIDRVVGPISYAPFSITVPDLGGSDSVGPFSMQVSDPRLNHVDNQWSAAQPTPGEVNLPGVNARVLEGQDMFVRDGPLQCVSELGFLLSPMKPGQGMIMPWQTVDLFTPEGRQLLTRFRAETITGQGWTNGKLNPNTLFSNTLYAAFHGVNIAEVPELDVPGQPPYTPWSDLMQIEYLANSMYDNSVNALTVGADSYDSAAGWVDTVVMRSGQALAVVGLNNNQREAIIRNSYRMFQPTENLFTVFVVAQVFGDGDVNNLTGEKRAVAQVWRDPFPNANNRHDWFIRMMRYLDD
jgi:hypothetical protein